MKDEDFDRAYKMVCDAMDHGNPRYGARILDVIREEVVARNLPVPGVTA